MRGAIIRETSPGNALVPVRVLGLRGTKQFDDRPVRSLVLSIGLRSVGRRSGLLDAQVTAELPPQLSGQVPALIAMDVVREPENVAPAV